MNRRTDSNYRKEALRAEEPHVPRGALDQTFRVAAFRASVTSTAALYAVAFDAAVITTASS